jgi:hypothetical protein
MHWRNGATGATGTTGETGDTGVSGVTRATGITGATVVTGTLPSLAYQASTEPTNGASIKENSSAEIKCKNPGTEQALGGGVQAVSGEIGLVVAESGPNTERNGWKWAVEITTRL